MALRFSGAETHHVNHGSASGLDNLPQGTYMLWTYLDTVANGNFMSWANKGVDLGPALINPNANGDAFRIEVKRVTVNQEVTSSDVLTTGWNFLAATWDITNGGPRVYRGTLTSAPVDVSGTPVDGSGAQADDSGSSLIVGHWPEAGFTRSVHGSIAWFGMWNIDLSLAQIAVQWRTIRQCLIAQSNNVLFINYGLHSATASQADWSGAGNPGTPSGPPTIDSHVGLPLFGNRPWVVVLPPSGGITGTLAKTLDSLTLSSTAALALEATAAPTLGALTASATGALAIEGALATTLVALTSTAAGAVALEAALAQTLSALTAAATGALAIDATLGQTLAALTLAATGDLEGNTGALAATLGALTAAATGALPLAGTATVSLAALTVTATATLDIDGQAAVNLETLTLTGVGVAAVVTTISLTLRSRSFALTPETRAFSLTLRSRSFALILGERE